MSPLIDEIRHARLTPRTSRDEEGTTVISGAVYADGRIVEHARRRHFPDRVVTDPAVLDVSEPAQRVLPGRWLYGGIWMRHFGHFIIETLTGVWPEPEESFDGVVFHELDPAARKPWQQDLLLRTGWAGSGLRTEWVDRQPGQTEVEELVVPTVGFHLGRSVLGAVRSLWERMMVDTATEGPVFLSRARMGHDQKDRRYDGDLELDALLEARGIRVVRPETLSIEEQLRSVASASALVGFEGSQLHLSAFARRGTPVVSIGNGRNRAAANRTQWLICEVSQQPLETVPLLTCGDRRDVDATVSAVLRALDPSAPKRRPQRRDIDERVSVDRGTLLPADLLMARISGPATVLQIGNPTEIPSDAPSRTLPGEPRQALDRTDGARFTLVHLLQPGDFRQRYRDVMAALELLEPGGAVLLGDTVPVQHAPSGHAATTARPTPPPPGNPREAWKVVAALALHHDELDYRTVLGGWVAPTLIWRRSAEPTTSIEGTPAFERIAQFAEVDILGHGLPGWYRTANVEEAFRAWRGRFSASLDPPAAFPTTAHQRNHPAHAGNGQDDDLDATGIIEVIERARLTPSERRTDGPIIRQRGAVYADGRVVRGVLRQPRRSYGNRRIEDPAEIDTRETARRILRGTWLYGGFWHDHFGHFLLETFSSLWPDPDPALDGLIFHRVGRSPIAAWQYDLIHRSGWTLPMLWVDDTPGHTEVERLIVPHTGFRIRGAVVPAVRQLWERTSNYGPIEGPLLLSRAGQKTSPTGRVADGDLEIEYRLADAGVRVVRPETLTIDQQLRLVGSASAIIGMEGSQLHLSAFARPGTPVVSIASLRGPDRTNDSQWSVCAQKAQPLHVVPFLGRLPSRSVEATVSAVHAALNRPRPSISPPTRDVHFHEGPEPLVQDLMSHSPVSGTAVRIGDQRMVSGRAARTIDSITDLRGERPALIHLLEPSSLVPQYRTFLRALEEVTPGGAVLVANVVPQVPFLRHFLRTAPRGARAIAEESAADHEFWQLAHTVARLHPEIGFRTVLSPWRAHMLCWKTSSSPLISAERTTEFEAVARLTADEAFAEGVPLWFAWCGVEEAVDAWTAGVRPLLDGR